jgi:hypothetical protein
MPRTAKQRSRRSALLAAALLAGALAGCAAPPAVREYQDERTAVTVTVAGTGLLFGEAQAAYSANARNFLTLAPVEINRGGARTLCWYGYAWSTLDRSFGHEAPIEYVLEADGRQIKIALRDTSLSELGVSEAPVKPPSSDARMVVAVTSRADLRLVAQARELIAFGIRGGALERYELWEDGRAAIAAFLDGDAPER